MWPKALFSISCVLLCGACGNAAAQQMEKRWRLLETLGRDMRLIRSRIAFGQIPLCAILEELHASPTHELWDAARKGFYLTDCFEALWRKTLAKLEKTLLSALKEEEMQLLLEFGRRLTEAESADAQLLQIDMTLERLYECAKETKCEIQKKSRLFRTLGTMAGFAVMIALW